MAKVAIVGAGAVGATLAYTLASAGIVDELVLIDSNEEKARAEVLDIAHGTPLGQPLKIYQAGYGSCADADLAVVTAGAKQRPGETRDQLLGRNAAITESIADSIYGSGFAGIFLMVSNPVDALTAIAHRVATKKYGREGSSVFGSGTVLDSARFREFIARRCDINPANIHGYVLGEHGDSSFPAWSLTTIGGASVDRFCQACGGGCGREGRCGSRELVAEAQESVRKAAYEIIQAKGATYYGIARAASTIVQAVLRDERRILPVSCVREDYRGLALTAFSFPAIVSRRGVQRVLDLTLPPEEDEKLMASATFVSEMISRA